MAGRDEPPVRADQQLETIAAAQAAIARAVSEGFLKRDPLRFVMEALSMSLGAMEQVLSGAIAAANAAVVEAKRPIPADMHRAAVAALVTEAVALFREEVAHDNRQRRRTVSIGSLLAGLALAGMLGGAAYWVGRSESRSACDGGQVQVDPATGRALCVQWLAR